MPKLFRPRLITITSETAVGSSTLIKEIERVKGAEFRYISGGSIMRGFAAAQGMSIDAFAAYNREHPEAGIDLRCDEALAHEGKTDGAIIESRLGHVFVPAAFHVLLTCPIEIRTGRRFKQYQELGRPKTYDQVWQEISERDKNDNERYKTLYLGCLWPKSHYDLVLETNKYTPAQLVEKLFRKHNLWLEEKKSKNRLAV